ncbi:MAG: YicC family protein [Succinivibrionaceae bacterium]|nr:YicC family protein [Succinivibrionaceae bacterium]
MGRIMSMTGFATRTMAGGGSSYTCTVRSVNGRFLDLSFRLPEGFRHLEGQLREAVRRRLSRGKVDITITEEASVGGELTLNEELLRKLGGAARRISEAVGGASVDATALLAWPGMVVQPAGLGEGIVALLDSALEGLQEARAEEGARLRDFLLERLQVIERGLDQVREMLDSLTQGERDRLLQRLEALGAEAEPGRLEQEVALLAQRSDVREEHDRLRAHIASARGILEAGGVCGKRLDFLMQEFNREANTTASKSTSIELTRIAIEFKVAIEQMREQVQNLE